MADVVRKVSMCGDPNVGKTSLVRRFVSGKYDEKYISTLGTMVSRKAVRAGNYNVNLMIWDISGQPEFKRIHTSAFRNSAGGLAVCDLTRPDTAEHLRDWIGNLRRIAGKDVPVVILANKADLLEDEAGYASDVERVADEFNCPLLNTSARTGSNVEEAFRTLANSVASDVRGAAPEDGATGEPDSDVETGTYTPAEFLDYAAVRFCEFLGDEEIGMHMVRKQVRDMGIDFRRPGREGVRSVVERLSSIINGQKGDSAGREFRQDLLKAFDRVRV